MNNEKNSGKNLIVNTIPLSKLTVILNEFIVNTVNHMNKYIIYDFRMSVYVESKLSNFNKKLRDIDTMVSLLEAKFDSLPPEVTSKFPQVNNSVNFEFISKEEANTQINVDIIKENIIKPEEKMEENKVITEEEEQTPQKALNDFLEKTNSEEINGLFKMLKYGVPEQALIQKATIGQMNLDTVRVIY